MPFQPKEILRVLFEAEVEFIIVGGLAAVGHGCSQSTIAFDAVAPLTVENCRKILKALGPFHPRFYQTIGAPPVDRTAEDLSRFRNLYFGTDLGTVDLLGSLPPVGDFETVASRAVSMTLFGFSTRFLSLDDLITVKAYVGRPKDKLVENELRAIRAKLKATQP